MHKFLRAADKLHLAPGLTCSRAQIYNDIGGHNYLGIVFNYQQGISRISQPGQDTDQPADIPGVQTNTRFVEDEQGVYQGGAESGGEIDALHLATAESARLAVEGKIPNPDLIQIV